MIHYFHIEFERSGTWIKTPVGCPLLFAFFLCYVAAFGDVFGH